MRLNGNWSIERQMHDGTWHTFGQGFVSAESAKASCKGHAPMSPHSAQYRVSDDNGFGYKATLTAGERAKWSKL